MTLVKRFEKKETAPRKASHKESRASYAVFERDGQQFLQIVTYGHGNKPDKVSQTIQLDRDGAHDLFQILKRTFNFE